MAFAPFSELFVAGSVAIYYERFHVMEEVRVEATLQVLELVES